MKAGNFLGIALDLGRISQEQMTALKTKLEATKAKLEAQDFGTITKEDILGDLLYTTALSYHAEVGVMKQIAARTMGIVAITLPSETIFSFELKSNFVFGIPISASPGGLAMDADRLLTLAKALDGNRDKPIQYFLSTGSSSSAFEHSVPEQLFSTADSSVQGISAVKALKIANDQGIPVYRITKNNIDSILPSLQLESSVVADIRDAVNAGKDAVVSKTNIDFQGWAGCGYVIIDPVTGSGGYVISGGSHGARILSMLGFPMWLYLTTSVEAFKTLCTKVIGIEVTEPEDLCGSEGTEWVPDFPFGIDARRACEKHDNCYIDAQTFPAKLSCDVTLGIDLYYDCIFQGRDAVLCRSVGGLYAAGVIIFGWDAWSKAR